MKRRPLNFPILKRWIMFNSVGAMGIGVQMAVLTALTSGLGLHYLAAVGLAVEAAVLHNFFWHERWTWADRRTGGVRGFLRRFLLFHGMNGALSLAGNIVLMRFFVEGLGLHYLPANAAAIAICSLLNFIAGERVVFRSVDIARKMKTMKSKLPHAVWPFILIFIARMPGVEIAHAAELRPDTLEAWHAYVQETEKRMAGETSSSSGFFAMDFQEASEARRERHAVLSGEIMVKQVETKMAGSGLIEIPYGEVHHWRGAVFIPGITLDELLDRLENPNFADAAQEDVLEARILERTPAGHRLYLKIQRSRIVTVQYNTEHWVRYRRYGPNRAASSSVATKIAEIERLRNSTEQEKPQGRGRGFLWRMNSYWRYEQTGGGVLVECESLTLSRSIPLALEYLARPLISRVARESMQRTLESLRRRMTRRM